MKTNTIIDKFFFTKVVFKIFVVLVFFLGLGCFIYSCSNYQNPYRYNTSTKYDNIIEFIDKNIALDIKYKHDFYWPYFEYVQEFVKQARSKHIFSGHIDASLKYNLLEKVYSCIPNKLENFKNEYKFVNGVDYYYLNLDDEFSVDCEKAQNVPLEAESYYFLKHVILANIVISFVCLPLTILILWAILRFIIISPILWIFKKD